MAGVLSGFVLMEKAVPQAATKFALTTQADPTTIIDLVFHVKDNENAKLEDILQSVSDPTSQNYGKHLSKSEVDALTENPQAVKATMTFLESVPGVTIAKGHPYHISASATVATWEAALSTSFYNYEKVDENGTKLTVIRTAEYSLPEAVAQHVSSVYNTVQFPVDLTHKGPVVRPLAHHAHVATSQDNTK